MLLLANPTAGQGRGDEALDVVERALGAGGVEVEVHRTSGPGDARERARRAEAEGVGVLVAVGGDGTLHEALNGLCEGAAAPGRPAPALGLVPVGTGNDYAKMLAIPGRDPARAAEVLLAGAARRVDLGYLRGAEPGPEWFMNNVGLGFLGVANAAHEIHRWMPGRLSYSLGGFLEYLRYRPSQVRVVVDGQELVRSAFGVQLSIGRYCGGGIQLAPDATLDAGRLDVCVISAQPKLRTLLEWPRIAAGEKLAAVTVLAGRHVRFEGAPGTVLHADGEVRRAPEGWVEAELLPGALTVLDGRPRRA
ncbi:MAG: diacylglycerol kinase family protein [Planctomycetota bacterium]